MIDILCEMLVLDVLHDCVILCTLGTRNSNTHKFQCCKFIKFGCNIFQ